ncbi:MAG: hypothetical protein KA230_05390 [Flavobacteriales bacterium]|nr:hypothetical protein [Flavobacteriales bacterium]
MLTKRICVSATVVLTFLFGCITGDPSVPTEQNSMPSAELEAAPSIPPTAKKSQLSQLMRTLTAHADSARAAIKRNGDLPPYPTAVDELLTATSTDSTLDRHVYSILANDYLGTLKKLYAAPAADRTQAYNGMVQSCATCHGSLCPGPLVVIRKMYAPQPAKPL